MFDRFKTILETEVSATACKGLLGILGAGTGFAVSLSTVIQTLQVVSLALGITIAVATLISLYDKGTAATKKTVLFILGLITAVSIVTLLAGCAGYRHSRTVTTFVTFSPDGIRVVSVPSSRTKESTTAGKLFEKGEAAGIQSVTTDTTNGYARAVGLQNVKTSGDAQTIEATGNAAGNAANRFLNPTP